MITPSRPPVARRWIAVVVALAVASVAVIAVWRWLGGDNAGSEWGQVVRSPVAASGTAGSAPGTVAKGGPTATPAPAPLPRLAGGPRYTTALARTPDGALWVGAEDDGVVRYDPSTNVGRAFKTRDGLGDDTVYALAVDRLGRLWAGHLNHGVSVFDGNAQGRWQNYEVVGGLSRLDSLSGPIGERVFDIAVCPTDGDVWIATNCGLSRYSESTHLWSYVTRLDGLPSDDVVAIAFDAAGILYAATAADGLAIAMPQSGYREWRSVRGPDRPPTTISGDGLPSDLLNDVLVASDGTIFVATNTGLAFSVDRGNSFRFVRGRDWADKVKNRRGGPPPGWQATGRPVLSDDFCTTLAEDVARRTLWVGHPGGPVETIDLKAPASEPAKSVPGGHWPRAILTPGPNDPPVVTVAGYGDADGGLWRTPAVGRFDALYVAGMAKRMPPAGPPPLPAAATPLTADALAALATRVNAAATAPAPAVAVLNDDWRTQGSWLGRHGKYWALLAMELNGYVWGATTKPIAYEFELGPGFPRNRPQYWLHTPYTDNPRSLEIPRVWFDWTVRQGRSTWATDRRQADWNDAGEQHPMTKEGPDLYITIDVPPGEYTMSLYDYNKDGHDINSPYRGRDMTVSVYHHPPGSPMEPVASGGIVTERPDVRRRLRDFRGGVYQRYYVRGPGVVTVGCRRVLAPNAMLSAILLDTPDQRPAPFGITPPASPKAAAGSPPVYAPGRVVLDAECERFALSGNARPAGGPPLPDLETCQFSLWQFAAWERSQEARGQRAIRTIEQALRWDGVRKVSKGKGFEILSEYLAQHPN